MSRQQRRKRRKKHGCAKGVFVIFLLLIITCILIYTGVLKDLRTGIEKQFYPLEYKEEILYACEKYDFSPEFVCAVIHTESKFQSDASSHVGAQGLMQLMPETFQWLCALRGEEYIPENITIPKVNIDYGVYYLRYLTDKYSDPYTACAAYNAGFSNVDTWLQSTEYSSDANTLSSIPYKETSDYVEQIKDSEETYKRLYFSQ